MKINQYLEIEKCVENSRYIISMRDMVGGTIHIVNITPEDLLKLYSFCKNILSKDDKPSLRIVPNLTLIQGEKDV